jgi:hypothetical protein
MLTLSKVPETLPNCDANSDSDSDSNSNSNTTSHYHTSANQHRLPSANPASACGQWMAYSMPTGMQKW